MEHEENRHNDAMHRDDAARRHQQEGIKNDKATVRLPMLLGITLGGGILIGATFFGSTKSLNTIGRGYTKYREILQLIENNYVDSVNTD
ncbi:MAG: peptidase S41, partial [Oxalobacteraceae bacterium]